MGFESVLLSGDWTQITECTKLYFRNIPFFAGSVSGIDKAWKQFAYKLLEWQWNLNKNPTIFIQENGF